MYLQESIDNAILSYLYSQDSTNHKELAPKIKSATQDFPMPLDRLFKNMDISAGFGSLFYQMGPLLTMMILVQEITREKEFSLR